HVLLRRPPRRRRCLPGYWRQCRSRSFTSEAPSSSATGSAPPRPSWPRGEDCTMTYRVLLSDSLGPEGLARLREQPDLEVDAKPGLTPAELMEIVGGYDALVVRSATKVTADVIARADAPPGIGRAGIGVDNIDVEAAT